MVFDPPKSTRDPIFRERFLPFFHVNPPRTFWGQIWVVARTIFGAIFLLIPRVILSIPFYMLFFLTIALFGTKFDENNPTTNNWRRHVVLASSRFCARGILFCYGFMRIKIYGKKEALAAQRRLNLEGVVIPAVVCPHQSWQDILIVASEGCTSFVATAELKKRAMIGAAAKSWGMVFLDRYSKESRENVGALLMKRTHTPGTMPMVIFPEGVTHNGRQILSFKEGIFRTGVPIQPIALRYPHRYFNPVYTESGALWQMFRNLTQLYNCAEVHYLPLHVPTPEEVASPSLACAAVRQEFSQVMHLPLVDLSVGDRRLFQRVWEGKTTAAEALEEQTRLRTCLSSPAPGVAQ
ncbi:putative lysophosphatidylcholine acyltransferase 2 [Paratrimastix pyriformis]|uniref:Lysophosphatidylcholine acyltransferase 2 n=1 Tax=Paratrimastix pyriformis TaxID=342808 RepID=A0ABQ8UU98_9EUKA|nr:putative lysophosphatidylcholine acyltransferase 2 [Paratrimastix pyriformis]|eukprot:GAFH01002617.1.p1 GENE.GAFH01002617.1~~GAFH01002617.1.p1  ORF type:complete len:351 (+),score=63.61 GAFH01002617.1:18-1070(+)